MLLCLELICLLYLFPLSSPFQSLLTVKLQSPGGPCHFHKTRVNSFQMMNSSRFMMIARTSGNSDMLALSFSGSYSSLSLPGKISCFTQQRTGLTQVVLGSLPQKQAEWQHKQYHCISKTVAFNFTVSC